MLSIAPYASSLQVFSGRVVKLADTQDLGSCAARLAGSSPASPTSLRSQQRVERRLPRRKPRNGGGRRREGQHRFFSTPHPHISYSFASFHEPAPNTLRTTQEFKACFQQEIYVKA